MHYGNMTNNASGCIEVAILKNAQQKDDNLSLVTVGDERL
jgi:hypothetical protein